MEQMTETQCVFCGSTWGLRSESIDNIEDLFMNYIQHMQDNNSEPEID
jgi:hypothetical protein